MSYETAGIRFDERELRDLLIAWLALGVAFTLFAERDLQALLRGGQVDLTAAQVGITLLVSLLTVGVGFLLHELAHKVVAVRFGQVAAFRANYGWLFLAIMGGLVGFLFAAPGAVYHRGEITPRENGLISVAGPITNLGLAVAFFGVLSISAVLEVGGVLSQIGRLGLGINLLLAGFNMIPFGPLDGKKVLAWNKLVFAVVAVPSILLGFYALSIISL